MRKLGSLTIMAIAASAFSALAGEQSLEDFFGSYFHRTDTVTVGAGDAKNVNAMSEMLDPWPPYVGNRKLPANGSRMTGAIQRYQDVRKIQEGAPPLAPSSISAKGISSGSQGQ